MTPKKPKYVLASGIVITHETVVHPSPPPNARRGVTAPLVNVTESMRRLASKKPLRRPARTRLSQPESEKP